MRLEGWNRLPRGYGAYFDLAAAPWWLRGLFRSPFIDRFAYPILVSRGYGWLTAQPGVDGDEAAATARGWRISTDPQGVDGDSGPGVPLVRTSAAALRWRGWRQAMNTRRGIVVRTGVHRATLPDAVTLPGGRRMERRNIVAWRVRGPLWALAILAGRRVFGRLGWLPGLALAVAAEVVFSYRPHRDQRLADPEDGPLRGEPAGR